jgi:hypothetical protein
MQLPPRRSRLMKIINTLRASGPLTVDAGIKLHGLSCKITVAELAEMYKELVVMGCLTQVGKHYRISRPLQDHFAQALYTEAPPAATVAPRTAPPFRPLSRRFMVSSLGTREGSNDLHDIPSTYAKLG